MGIKGLPAYLRRHAAGAFVKQRTVDAVIDSLRAAHAKRTAVPAEVSSRPPAAIASRLPALPRRHPAVAVDVPSLFYRVMYCAPDTEAGILTFLAMFQPLRAAGVTVVFVFDNARKPNKGPERERRRARANADRKRLAELKEQLGATKAGPTPDQDVGEWMQAIEEAQDSHDKVAKRIDVVCPRDYTVLDAVMVACGYTTWLARDEGEAAAAYLYKTGQVDGVISDDFDVLPLGVGLFIRNYGNYYDHKRVCEAVYLNAVLRAISLPFDQFLQMCVLCGSDFTEHLKGMGPVKARKMLGIYKDLKTYFGSAEYRAAYGGGPPFEYETALAQFQHPEQPVLSVAALLALYGRVARRIWEAKSRK